MITTTRDLYDPRLDFVAKRIFTAETPEFKQALIAFLNASLRLTKAQRIVDLTIISPVIPAMSSG